MLADRATVDDATLVAAVRRGDDRAFEELYGRYRQRITGFVGAKVHDHARAEDITQDVFVSALRRMRATEAPIAFRPWIYEIARNACIDAYRRGRRAEQVPLDSERLAPADRDRLVAGGPAPDAAVAVKEELDHLRGAFGSLSDQHHEILVLRELEGLSYDAIGERLGMTRAGVESTLFRARRRLGEEFEGIASGERCTTVQAILADAGERRLGVRERRRVTSHAAHCDACRRVAVAAEFQIDVPRRRRIARKLGGWLPIPAFLRRGGEQVVTAAAGRGSWLTHVPGLAEPGWGKAVAGIAALAIAGAGAGVTVSHGEAPATRAPAVAPARDADAGAATSRGAVSLARAELHPATTVAGGVGGRAGAEKPAGARRSQPGADRAPAGRDRGARADGEDAAQPARDAAEGTRQAVRDTADKTRQAVRKTADDTGKAVRKTVDGTGKAVRKTVDDTGKAVRDTTDTAGDTVRDTVDTTRTTVRDTVDATRDTVRRAVQQPAQTVKKTVANVPQAAQDAGQTAQNAASNTTSTVNTAVKDVQNTAADPASVVPNASNTANNAVSNAGSTVNNAVSDAGKTVGGLLKP